MNALLEADDVDAAQARPIIRVSPPATRRNDATSYDQAPSFYEEWIEALRAFRKVAELDDDWDESGSLAPSPDLLENVASLLQSLRRFGVPAPQDFSVGTQGEIALCWFGGRENYFEIRVLKPNDARWMAVMPGCATHHGRRINVEAGRWLDSVLKGR
jgi:hypothetical protein